MHGLYGENVLKYYFIIIILFILSVFFLSMVIFSHICSLFTYRVVDIDCQ